MDKPTDRAADVTLELPAAGAQSARGESAGSAAASPAAAYLNGLGGGQRTQRSALRGMAVLLGWRTPFEVPWSSVTGLQVRQLRARLRSLYGPATVNRWLSALRGVLTAARTFLGRDDAAAGAEEWVRVQVELRGNESGAPTHGGRALGMPELAKLLKAGRPTADGLRDTAMVAVMYGAGLRRDSIVKLDVVDWKGDGELVARKAKGGKTYSARMHPTMAVFLTRWLELRGNDDGPMFPRILPNQKTTRSRLSVQAVSDAIERLRVAAGVDPFTPHDLRRTFGTEMLASGEDTSAVAKLMGHEDTKTTLRYDRREQARLQESVEKLPDPMKED